jgi:hypothetical protein
MNILNVKPINHATAVVKRFVWSLAILLPLHGNAATEFYLGLWEIGIQVQMTGMPSANQELKRVQHCVRQLDDLITLFKPDPHCRVLDIKNTESAVSWRLYCETRGTIYRGKAEFTRDSKLLRGHLDLKSFIPGVGETMVTTYRAKGAYMGSCQ